MATGTVDTTHSAALWPIEVTGFGSLLGYQVVAFIDYPAWTEHPTILSSIIFSEDSQFSLPFSFGPDRIGAEGQAQGFRYDLATSYIVPGTWRVELTVSFGSGYHPVDHWYLFAAPGSDAMNVTISYAYFDNHMAFDDANVTTTDDTQSYGLMDFEGEYHHGSIIGADVHAAAFLSKQLSTTTRTFIDWEFGRTDGAYSFAATWNGGSVRHGSSGVLVTRSEPWLDFELVTTTEHVRLSFQHMLLATPDENAFRFVVVDLPDFL